MIFIGFFFNNTVNRNVRTNNIITEPDIYLSEGFKIKSVNCDLFLALLSMKRMKIGNTIEFFFRAFRYGPVNFILGSYMCLMRTLKLAAGRLR